MAASTPRNFFPSAHHEEQARSVGCTRTVPLAVTAWSRQHENVSPWSYHLGHRRKGGGQQMESSLGKGARLRNDHAEDETAVKSPDAFAAGVMSGLSVYESSFPARVAAFLRFSPVIEAAQAARRRGWPDGSYDIVTLALTAIDLVVSQQGFEMEATRADVVDALAELAC